MSFAISSTSEFAAFLSPTPATPIPSAPLPMHTATPRPVALSSPATSSAASSPIPSSSSSSHLQLPSSSLSVSTTSPSLAPLSPSLSPSVPSSPIAFVSSPAFLAARPARSSSAAAGSISHPTFRRLRKFGFFSFVRFRYYLSNAWREIRKRPFNYFLGSFSCFLVVCVAAICFTLIAKAPIVFIQQAEIANGQIDVKLTVSDINNFKTLNHTAIGANLAGLEKFSYHSSRISWPSGSVFPSECLTNLEARGIPGANWPASDSSWYYIGNPSTAQQFPSCTNITTGCFSKMCAQTNDKMLQFYALDTLAEQRMGLGRLWPFDVIPPNNVIISPTVAVAKNLKVGDKTVLAFYSTDMTNLLRNLISSGLYNKYNGNPPINSNLTKLLDDVWTKFATPVFIPVTIYGIMTNKVAKFNTEFDDIAIMEQSTFLPTLLTHLHPIYNSKSVSEFLQIDNNLQYYPSFSFFDTQIHGVPVVDPTGVLPFTALELMSESQQTLKSYVQEVFVNLPPNRITPYMDTNYDHVQDSLIGFSSQLIYAISFPDVAVTLPILTALSDLKMFSLYLGLILSIILTILFILSTMLIYSLLMISIETTQFTMAVQRMLGLTRLGVIQLLMTQACSYSIPAWALGLLASQLGALVVLKRIESAVEVPVDYTLTTYSIMSASVLGLFIPLVAAILPIKSALQKNLRDSLDTQHSKTLGVQFSIERSEGQSMDFAWLAFGLCLFVFGFLVYYLLPLSLLTFNLALFFNIFFGILLGMLIGLILISLNFEHSLERLLVGLLFFWERKVVTTLILKNLIAHRMRNRKTTIMFALALGFIIFITVAYQMEILSAQYRTLKTYGAPLSVSTGSYYMPPDAVRQFELTIVGHSAVKDYAWVSIRLGWDEGNLAAQMQNLGHSFTYGVGIYGLSPNFYDVASSDFVIVKDSDSESSLHIAEALYTIQGSQSAILPSNVDYKLGVTGLSGTSNDFLVATQRNVDPGGILELHRMRPLALLDATPRFGAFTSFPNKRGTEGLVSMLQFLRFEYMRYRSLRDLPMGYLLIQTQGTKAEIDDLKARIKPLSDWWGMDLKDQRDISATLQQSNDVMSIIFSAATYIAMGLCLFSLMASMYTNIFEQSKEIAILRAMGCTSPLILRLYLYEAFVLVLASSILGIIIGFIMSWTMSAQRELFTQLPIPIFFPYSALYLVFGGAILCSFLSSFTPAKIMLKKPVATILRMLF